MSEKEGVTLPSLKGAVLPSDPLDVTIRRSSSNRSHAGGELVRRLQKENARLKEELESLKAMYSRRISHDESLFEQKLMQKDLDCENWYKSKKYEMKQLQAGTVIMQSLFDMRKKKFYACLASERQKFEAEKKQYQEEVAHIQQQLHEKEMENKKDLEWHQIQWDRYRGQLEQEKESEQAHSKLLKEQLSAKHKDCEKLRTEQQEQAQALEQLRGRLMQIERADELLKRNSQIEALEAELKKTKKMVIERQQGEADGLRRELQEYVKFIVQVLPAEFQNQGKEHDGGLRTGTPTKTSTASLPCPRSPPRKQGRKYQRLSNATNGLIHSPYAHHGTFGGSATSSTTSLYKEAPEFLRQLNLSASQTSFGQLDTGPPIIE